MSKKPMNYSRRDFLKGLSCTVAAGGVSSFVPKMNLIATAAAQSSTPGYKAVVCLYLNGGNDSWNLLIPTGAPANGQYSHAAYVAARNGLYTAATTNGLAIPNVATTGALPPALSLNTGVGAGNLGVNPFAPGLRNLYNSGKLAFLANVGTLVEPITRQTYNARRKPPQLYSHNDQTVLWQTGGSSTSSPVGFGGMIAGYTANTNALGLPPAISVAGQTRFLVGRRPDNASVLPFQLSTSSTTPATSLSNYNPNSNALGEASRRAALEQLLDAANPAPFSTEYADIVERSLVLSRDLNAEIASLPATAGNPIPFPANNGLADQLRQVVRTMRISRPGYTPPAAPPGEDPYSAINANRQVFYVSTGGFDTHDNQITSVTAAQGHHGLLQRVSQAVEWFYNELVALGMQNDVTLFSISDFARTINSNGNGTDHAWGSVQFVVGGAVNGGQVYGRYPAIVLNNSAQAGSSVSVDAAQGECFSRGQFLPTMAVDQVAATLARWMGVDDANLDVILPNLANFAGGPFANATASPTFASFTRTIPFLPV